VAEPILRTALARRADATGLAIEMREIGDRGMIDLRGLPSDPAFMSAVRSALGVDLPVTPRTSASAGDITVLWLSVDQWLILCALSNAAELHSRLREALAGIHALAVDVSHMRTVIRLEGGNVREVLIKGTSLDLLGEDYPPGTVRRLLFAEIAALIHIAAQDMIDLYVFRSYADYAWDFLVTAANPAAALTVFGNQQPAPV
jgi:sarcosine oxidase subunit gamma